MPFEMDFQLRITKAKWLEHPAERWNAGLVRAGMSFHNQLQRTKYPDAPPNSTYERTMTLAKKAGFRIVEVGNKMEFGSTHYFPFLMSGTGIFGPLGRMITPKNKSVLVWGGGKFFAKSVKGSGNWKPKKEQIITRMRAAFYRGITKWDKENDRPQPDGNDE